jgi:MFS family permease
VAGGELRRFASDRRGLALDFFVGTGIAALLTLSDTLIQATILLPAFVAQLTESNRIVAVIPAIGIGGWSLSRLLAGSVMQGRRRRLPWAVAASLVGTAALSLLAIVALGSGAGDRDRLLRSFVICYAAYSVAAGFASVPTTSILTKGIVDQHRGRFFRQRGLWSSGPAVLGALVAARLLGSQGPSFPRDFALLFLASAVCSLAAAFFVAILHEPLRMPAPLQPSLGSAFGSGANALRDPNMRRFLGFRVLIALVASADPFYVVYAVRELGVGLATVGRFVVVLVVARLVGRVLWAPSTRARGERAILQLSSLARLVIPLVALLVPYLIEGDLLADRVSDERLTVVLVGALVALYGLTIGGQEQANFAYLLDIAPAQRRLGYVGFTNLVLAVAAIAPIGAAVVIDRAGSRALFLGVAALAFVAILASGALTETLVRSRATPSAWRLRGASGIADRPG